MWIFKSSEENVYWTQSGLVHFELNVSIPDQWYWVVFVIKICIRQSQYTHSGYVEISRRTLHLHHRDKGEASSSWRPLRPLTLAPPPGGTRDPVDWSRHLKNSRVSLSAALQDHTVRVTDVEEVWGWCSCVNHAAGRVEGVRAGSAPITRGFGYRSQQEENKMDESRLSKDDTPGKTLNSALSLLKFALAIKPLYSCNLPPKEHS